MNRRQFLERLTITAILPPLLPGCSRVQPKPGTSAVETVRRVRPGDALWPSQRRWDELGRAVGGRLFKVESPLTACRSGPNAPSCTDLFTALRNPYYIGDHPALTQTSGYADAWTLAPSVYAISATGSADVVAAVNFARDHKLRLVVKGGGHSYHGGSCSADSLLIWTRAMNGISLHDSFVPQGCVGRTEPQPAVTVEAGALWVHVYDAVTTRAGRYVQGGGCTTVGVAGLIQSGGFGSFSKMYGLAAAGLLEAEIVTADGRVRVANTCTNPNLFWALKGGGGGSFGVVTKLTLRTRELPEWFGSVSATIRAHSAAAFRRLIARVLVFYRERLFNPYWGEQIRFGTDNTLELAMMFSGLNRHQAEAAWRPFLAWVTDASQDFSVEVPARILDIPARHLWDATFLKQHHPEAIVFDDRPGAPESNFLWAATQNEVGQFLHAYQSTWLPASLLEDDQQKALVDAIVAATRHWSLSLHFNKGLAGAPRTELEAARDTAMNPAALDAFALVIMGSESPPAFPGIRGHEPDLSGARRDANAVNRAMDALLQIVDRPASYSAETNFFESDWQQSFWGPNYDSLAAIKKEYDPEGLFFVHHGVGSENWSADGFRRVSA